MKPESSSSLSLSPNVISPWFCNSSHWICSSIALTFLYVLSIKHSHFFILWLFCSSLSAIREYLHFFWQQVVIKGIWYVGSIHYIAGLSIWNWKLRHSVGLICCNFVKHCNWVLCGCRIRERRSLQTWMVVVYSLLVSIFSENCLPW